MHEKTTLWRKRRLTLASLATLVLLLGADTGCREIDPVNDFFSQKTKKAVTKSNFSAHHLMRHFRSEKWGYGVEIPRVGFAVNTSDYNRDLPPRKFFHRLIVRKKDGRDLVALQLWRNPLRLDLEEWFDRFVSGLVSEQARRTNTSAETVDALIFARGPSLQSPARRQAFLRLGPWMARLVCFDDDDPEAGAIFDHMLATLHSTEPAEVQP